MWRCNLCKLGIPTRHEEGGHPSNHRRSSQLASDTATKAEFTINYQTTHEKQGEISTLVTSARSESRPATKAEILRSTSSKDGENFDTRWARQATGVEILRTTSSNEGENFDARWARPENAAGQD